MNEEEKNLDLEDEADELFGWMADTFNSGGNDLNAYAVTLENETIKTITDGDTTVNLT
jgi:hypothetical protein